MFFLKINKIAFSSNDDSMFNLSVQCYNIIKRYKNNYDDIAKENIKKHNKNCPQTPDHPYRILIPGGSESGKTNSLFTLMSHQLDIDL